MKAFKISDVISATGGAGENITDASLKIKSVTMDSRKVEEGSLFVAIKGERVDGHDFMNDCFSKGATAVLCDHVPEGVKGPCIVVKDTVKGLQELAKWYRESLNVKVVGVTGSVGKTSTKEMVSAVLSEGYRTLKTIGNYNNEIGLPLTVLAIEEDTEVSVLEMGISDFGEMRVLSRIAQPNVCVITNIGECHLEFLHDRDGVLKAKTEIFEFMSKDAKIYLNGDDDKLRTVKEVSGIKPVFYGFNKDNDVTLLDSKSLGLKGSDLKMSYKGETLDATIHMLGKHMMANALVSFAIAKDMGLTDNQIKEGLSKAKTIDGRSNLIEFKNKGFIIDDCYNASPTSMKAALDLLTLSDGKKVAVLGDMFELGDDSKAMHAEVGTYAATVGIDKLICVGENSKDMYDAAVSKNKNLPAVYFKTLDELLSVLTKEVCETDSILVKSSHGMGFAKLVEALKDR